MSPSFSNRVFILHSELYGCDKLPVLTFNQGGPRRGTTMASYSEYETAVLLAISEVDSLGRTTTRGGQVEGYEAGK